MKKLGIITLFFISFYPLLSIAQNDNDCNISINKKSIRFNSNLDVFLKSLGNDSFSVSADRNQIPKYIIGKLYCLIDTLANKDEEWSSGCMQFEGIPKRQLLFHAINMQQNTFVIVYKKGGVGVSTFIIMMKLTNKGVLINEQKNVEDIWIGSNSSFEGKDVLYLASFLEANRYFDQLNTEYISY